MEYQVIVDTDYILGLCKSINSTSNEISNSINSLQRVCSDLGSNVLDKNMQNFKNNSLLNAEQMLAQIEDIKKQNKENDSKKKGEKQ